jgi:hypothetical protein
MNKRERCSEKWRREIKSEITTMDTPERFSRRTL